MGLTISYSLALNDEDAFGKPLESPILEFPNFEQLEAQDAADRKAKARKRKPRKP
ncbi:MAG: hypothetical protein ACKV0T_15290 [Planctomycetales bacterium]